MDRTSLIDQFAHAVGKKAGWTREGGSERILASLKFHFITIHDYLV